MRAIPHKGLIRLLAVLSLTLAVFGLALATRGAPSAQAAEPAAPVTDLALAPAAQAAAQAPDNGACLACHGRPDQLHEFPNGDVVSISVDPEVYEQTMHANLACTTCHTNISDYPHPENPAESAREYTLQYADSCDRCHPGQAEEILDSAHASLPVELQEAAPRCADCHNPHAQPDIVTDENGDPVPAERPHIAEVCSQCHAGIVEEYRNSVHGEALFEESNPDVPSCNDCHGIHKIPQTSVEFRLNSPRMCAECHTREDIMGKYDISTEVLNTYVSDFHGTTWTLFEQAHTGDDTNKPVCYDCHGVHNIAAVDDPEQGIAMQENMLATCKRCHPGATENFSASWMSHYIASPTRFPLVYYVNLFYKIFIPLVLGGMALFVLSDILHRLGITGRRNRAGQADRASKE
jgi:hypothetical protein